MRQAFKLRGAGRCRHCCLNSSRLSAPSAAAMEHESILPTLDDEQVPEQPQEQVGRGWGAACHAL